LNIICEKYAVCNLITQMMIFHEFAAVPGDMFCMSQKNPQVAALGSWLVTVLLSKWW
jgi:hypothetical protein